MRRRIGLCGACTTMGPGEIFYAVCLFVHSDESCFFHGQPSRFPLSQSDVSLSIPFDLYTFAITRSTARSSRMSHMCSRPQFRSDDGRLPHKLPKRKLYQETFLVSTSLPRNPRRNSDFTEMARSAITSTFCVPLNSFYCFTYHLRHSPPDSRSRIFYPVVTMVPKLTWPRLLLSHSARDGYYIVCAVRRVHRRRIRDTTHINWLDILIPSDDASL